METCPVCASPMRLRNGKRGQFYGCSRYPNCNGTRDYVVTTQEVKTLPGSPEQEAIWHWLETGTENGVIEARAGTGKTFTIVQSIMRLRGKGRVAVFSFNTHIIKELNEKLTKEGISWARGFTFNSFGNKCIRNHSQLRDAELFQDKLPTLVAELFPDESLVVERQATEKLARLCKCYMEDGRDEDVLADLAEKFNVDFNGDELTPEQMDVRIGNIYKAVPKVLELCLNRRTTFDFDDQVWWTVQMRLPVEKFDFVFLDEAQDTNKMQQELVRMVCS